MSRRIADLASLQDRQLTSDLVRVFLGRRNDVKSSDAFAVQAGILGKTLGELEDK